MFTIYATVAEAVAFNQSEAKKRGCSGVTSEWYTRWDHPTDGRSALMDGTGSVTIDELEAQGWE